MEIHSFSHLHKICEAAAKKAHYPLIIEELQQTVPKKWLPMAQSTVIFFIPAAVLALKDRRARRDAIESIPDDTPVSNLKQFVKDGVTHLWEKQRGLEGRSSKRH